MTCTCAVHEDVNGTYIAFCPLHAAAPEMLAAIKRVREAFYVDGKRAALMKALEGTKELVTLQPSQPTA